MWIKNKEPVIQNGHMHRPKLTQALPVSPVYSSPAPPSLPHTTGSDRGSTSNQPLV